MEERVVNIYQIHRKSKGLTQEKAAEMLAVSVASLQDYEKGKTKVPDDIVVEMCKVYDTDRLAYQHLRQNAVGKLVLSELKPKSDLAVSILTFVKEFKDVANLVDNLISIGADGQIQDHEEKEVSIICEQLVEMINSSFDVMYSCNE